MGTDSKTEFITNPLSDGAYSSIVRDEAGEIVGLNSYIPCAMPGVTVAVDFNAFLKHHPDALIGEVVVEVPHKQDTPMLGVVMGFLMIGPLNANKVAAFKKITEVKEASIVRRDIIDGNYVDYPLIFGRTETGEGVTISMYVGATCARSVVSPVSIVSGAAYIY